MKRKRVILFLFATALVLLNLPLPLSMWLRAAARDNAAPFHSGFRALLQHGALAAATLRDGRRHAREADRLREELANAQAKAADLAALKDENRELRQALGFQRRSAHRLVMCRVVSRGGMGGWWQTLRLDKGRAHGIGENMAVVTMDGLVGRTGGGQPRDGGPGLVVSERASDVLLITDPGFKVACEIGEGGYFGIVSGAGPAVRGRPELDMLSEAAPFDMDFIPGGAVVKAGDRVVTSGLGGVIPSGLPVGFVREATADKSGLYLRAAIRPAADLRRLRHVFVVIPLEPATARENRAEAPPGDEGRTP